MNLNRRDLLLGLGLAGASLCTPASAAPSPEHHSPAADACARAAAECLAACARAFRHCLGYLARGEARHIRCLEACSDASAFCSACVQTCHGPRFAVACEACQAACAACAGECEKLPEDPVLQECARACRQCAQLCRTHAGGHP
jgi:hypothetical protein